MASGKITDEDILEAFSTDGSKPPETPVPPDFEKGLARELLLHQAWGLNPGPGAGSSPVTMADLDIQAFVFGGHQALTKHMGTGKFRPFDIYVCFDHGFYPAAVDVEQQLAVGGTSSGDGE